MDPIQDMLQKAQSEQRQEQMLTAMLRQAMAAPAVVKRASQVNLVQLAPAADGGVLLLVALPNGERWDVPLNAHQQRLIVQALAESAGEPS